MINAWFPARNGLMLALIILAFIWEAVWKGVAMWRAARNGHLAWFICVLIINTLGILPIIYILAFSRRKETAQAGQKTP
jgi:dolichyl-phosphate-mannose--protein O-mannosyl transferase